MNSTDLGRVGHLGVAAFAIALVARNARAGASAEAERAVSKSLNQLRAERQKRTGRSTCS
jgi:hypothetical protein